MKKLPLRFAIACLSFGLINPTFAIDNTSSNAVLLDSVDINGSRTAVNNTILPQGTIVLNSNQLERMPVSNLAEALTNIGNIQIGSYYGDVTGSYTTPDVGGYGMTAHQNTLLLLDGRRLNTVNLSSINLGSIPLSVIERIEVIPSSGSVLYGSNASGGVINIVTKTRYNNAGRFEGVIGEFNTRGGSAQGSFNQGNFSGFANVGRIGSDNYRENNKSSQQQAFGDIRYSNEKTTIYLTTLYNKQKLGLPGALGNTLLDQPYLAATPDDFATADSISLLPGITQQFGEGLTAHLDAGFRTRKQESEYILFGNTRDDTDRTLNISPRLTGDTNIIVDNHWTLGFDFYQTHYNLDEDVQFLPFFHETAKSHFKRSTQALYAQDSINIAKNTWLTLGARHEWIKTSEDRTVNDIVGGTTSHPQRVDEKNQEVSMWNAGIRHHLSDSFSVFTNAERSARYATVDEIAYWLGDQKTQTGKTLSVGGKWQKEGQHSTLTLWQTKLHHEIAYDPIAFSNLNLDDTKRQGISLNSYWKLEKNLWLALSGTYQEAKFDKGANKDNNVPIVPRVLAYARADWQPLAQLSFSIAERYQGKQYLDNDQSNTFGKRIPSYRWMDLSATYRPTGAKSVYLSAILHNAENRKLAYDYGTASTTTPGVYNAYPLPGRYVIVKAGVDF